MGRNWSRRRLFLFFGAAACISLTSEAEKIRLAPAETGLLVGVGGREAEVHRKGVKRGKCLRIQQTTVSRSLHCTEQPSPAVLCPRCLSLNLGCPKWAILSLLGDTLGMTQSRLGVHSSLSSAVGPWRRALSLPAGDKTSWVVSVTLVTLAPGETGICPKRESNMRGQGPRVRLL